MIHHSCTIETMWNRRQSLHCWTDICVFMEPPHACMCEQRSFTQIAFRMCVQFFHLQFQRFSQPGKKIMLLTLLYFKDSLHHKMYYWSQYKVKAKQATALP